MVPNVIGTSYDSREDVLDEDTVKPVNEVGTWRFQ